MPTVRKGDVDENGDRGKDAPVLSRSEERFYGALFTLGKFTPPILVVGIPVAFIMGVGTKLWQRAFHLGRRLG